MKSTNPLRQKLINLLYIVLICMIVLNLPLEFIEAFTDLKMSLDRANVQLDKTNRFAAKEVKKMLKVDTTYFGKIEQNIKAVTAIGDTAIQYLEDIKDDLLVRTKGMTEYRHPRNAIDATIPTRYMIRGGMAKETKEMLVKTKLELLKYLGNADQTLLDTVLITSDKIPKATGDSLSWEKYYFDNVPWGAVWALLTKFQNDVRVAQSIVVTKYYEQAAAGISYEFKDNFATEEEFDFEAIKLRIDKSESTKDIFSIGDEASYNVQVPGAPEELLKQAVIYTYDSKGNVIDSFLFKEGVGEINLPTGQIGEFKIKGVVKFRYKEEGPGEIQESPETLIKTESKKEDKEVDVSFDVPYSVVAPKPYISHRDYDIMYIGVNNPLEIYHPEFKPENYNVSISQGKITYDGKEFSARVYRPGFVMVSFSVPEQGGGFKKVDEKKFKVEELPKPRAKLYTQYGGQMPATIFKKQRELTADVQGLLFDAKFRVMEFTVTYVNKAGMGIFKERVNGSYFTDKSLELINLAEPGDIYIFENIKIKGPDGKNIDVEPLAFTII